jgi:hypothetical protein
MYQRLGEDCLKKKLKKKDHQGTTFPFPYSCVLFELKNLTSWDTVSSLLSHRFTKLVDLIGLVRLIGLVLGAFSWD